MEFGPTDSVPDRVRFLLGGYTQKGVYDFEFYELTCASCSMEIPTFETLECPSCWKSWESFAVGPVKKYCLK